MAVAAGPDQIPGSQVRLLCQDVSQQRVGCDVEWNTQENIGASLIDLAGKTAAGHVELEEGMAGCERHLLQFADVPCAHDDAARVRLVPELPDRPCDLVDLPAVGGAPGAPLLSVHGPKLAFRVRPFVP